jgi:hypothetical protein
MTSRSSEQQLFNTQPFLVMKKTLLIAFTAFTGLAQAQVVDSGFETWTNNLPDGWFGERSSILAAAVSQAATNAHSGNFAVRLENATVDHKRFTTQNVTVSAGTEYSITFWARGMGDVRFGVYDGRSGNGYSPYTSYITVANTDVWTEYTLSTNVVMDATNAQFILSVRSTMAPEHLVIDDVVIEAAGAIQDATIYDIQFTSDPSGDSPLDGEVVRTSGIVTAVDAFSNNGDPQLVYYLQDGSGAWNGIYVFDFIDNGNAVAVGDEIELIAQVSEYFGLTELSNIQSFTLLASAQPLPVPLVVGTGEVAAEALESVLVRVVDAVCTAPPSGANFGIWSVNDGSGAAGIGKEMHTTTPDPIIGQVYDITGVVSYGFEEYRIQPRGASDVALATSIDELANTSITMYPNPASDMLTLELDQVSGRTEYVISDLNGRIVANGVLNSDRTMIAVGALANGSYMITLRNDTSVRNLRMAVQH